MLRSMSDTDPSDSLLSALTKAQITSENHQFIRRLTETVGIASYRVVGGDKPYIAATRRDGLRDLHIYWGYTAGFPSENDARRASSGAGDVAPSSTVKSTWYVTHPVNRVHSVGERTKRIQREAGLCGSCSEQLPLTGVCDNCD